MLDDLRQNLPQMRDALRELPGVVQHLAEQIKSGDLQLKMDSPELQQIRDELKAQRQQRFWLVLAATGLLGGVLTLALEGNVLLGSAMLAAGAAAALVGRPNGSA